MNSYEYDDDEDGDNDDGVGGGGTTNLIQWSSEGEIRAVQNDDL